MANLTAKQMLPQTCICGKAMTFPEGEIKAICQTDGCGANWEIGPEGYWSITNIITPLEPILIKPPAESEHIRSKKPSKLKPKAGLKTKRKKRRH